MNTNESTTTLIHLNYSNYTNISVSLMSVMGWTGLGTLTPG